MTIKQFSKLCFLVMGAFHFILNYLIFSINYLNNNYIWTYNSNKIGEACIEFWMMTLLLPFIIYGFKLLVVE